MKENIQLERNALIKALDLYGYDDYSIEIVESDKIVNLIARDKDGYKIYNIAFEK